MLIFIKLLLGVTFDATLKCIHFSTSCIKNGDIAAMLNTQEVFWILKSDSIDNNKVQLLITYYKRVYW